MKPIYGLLILRDFQGIVLAESKSPNFNSNIEPAMIMLDAFAPFFAAPVLPATILLALVVAWSLITILVGIGSHHSLFGVHVDPFGGSDAHHGWGQLFHDLLGDTLSASLLAPLRWLNLNSLPIFVWLGIFSFLWCCVSFVAWQSLDVWLINSHNPWVIALQIARNLAIAMPATKIATTPVRRWFATPTPISAQSLVGQEAEIISFDATPQHGQAKYKTEGSPLLLHVRTDGPTLVKGTRVWLTYYNERNRFYIVSATTTSLGTHKG